MSTPAKKSTPEELKAGWDAMDKRQRDYVELLAAAKDVMEENRGGKRHDRLLAAINALVEQK